MKNNKYQHMKKIIFLVATIFMFSCEEVVDVNLSTASTKLVIDATISWPKGTTGSNQTIKLSTTTGYYETDIPKITGATVIVTNSSNQVFTFLEEISTTGNSGKYTCNNFVPQLNEVYTLTVIYDGQTYKSTEKLLPSPNIINVEQRDDLGLNSNEIGIKVNFKDYENQINYYSTKIETTIKPFPEYQTIPDEFTQGNIMSALYSNEKLKKNDVIKISLYANSKTFYNYMTILLINTNSNGPFQSPLANIRGNIINQSSKSNYALGFFKLSEVSNLEYTVQ